MNVFVINRSKTIRYYRVNFREKDTFALESSKLSCSHNIVGVVSLRGKLKFQLKLFYSHGFSENKLNRCYIVYIVNLMGENQVSENSV